MRHVFGPIKVQTIKKYIFQNIQMALYKFFMSELNSQK